MSSTRSSPTSCEAERIDDVEAVLTTLIESEPAQEPSVEDRETRSYAEGMRDGLALGVTVYESGGDALAAAGIAEA